MCGGRAEVLRHSASSCLTSEGLPQQVAVRGPLPAWSRREPGWICTPGRCPSWRLVRCGRGGWRAGGGRGPLGRRAAVQAPARAFSCRVSEGRGQAWPDPELCHQSGRWGGLSHAAPLPGTVGAAQVTHGRPTSIRSALTTERPLCVGLGWGHSAEHVACPLSLGGEAQGLGPHPRGSPPALDGASPAEGPAGFHVRLPG